MHLWSADAKPAAAALLDVCFPAGAEAELEVLAEVAALVEVVGLDALDALDALDGLDGGAEVCAEAGMLGALLVADVPPRNQP